MEELAWLRQAAGVPQRRKASTSQPPTNYFPRKKLRVAGPRHGAGRRVLFIGDRSASAKRPGASCRITLEPIAKEELRKRRYSSINPRSSRRSRPSRALL